MTTDQMKTLALGAAAAVLVAAIAIIATRKEVLIPKTMEESLEICRDLVELRLAGKDSGSVRRKLRAAVESVPETALNKTLRQALVMYADGKYEDVTKLQVATDVSFDLAVRGCALWELGRKEDAAAIIRKSMETSPSDWEYRALFQRVLKACSP